MSSGEFPLAQTFGDGPGLLRMADRIEAFAAQYHDFACTANAEDALADAPYISNLRTAAHLLRECVELAHGEKRVCPTCGHEEAAQ